MVQGRLIFSGTLDGVAEGVTMALIDAPCAQALRPNNLGAFRDVFRFEGTFTGHAAGVDASGYLTYAGVTRPGGSIDANIKLRANPAKAAYPQRSAWRRWNLPRCRRDQRLTQALRGRPPERACVSLVLADTASEDLPG